VRFGWLVGMGWCVTRRDVGCGLIEVGRKRARNFDAGHAPSGSGYHGAAHAGRRARSVARGLPRRSRMIRGFVDA
jgi:hypothetical protein